MTRGTVAFIDYDKRNDKYLLFVSEQFNGDMGPDMDKGEKLIRWFKDIYLDKSNNHQTKYYKMERIVAELNNTFGYEREVSFKRIPLTESSYEDIWINLRTKYLDKEKKDIDYNSDIWSTWFDYSDFLYIVPICDIPKNTVIVEEKEDGSQNEHYLEKDNLYVFCFRKYVGHVSSKDGRYVEENQEYSDDSTDENETFGTLERAAPPLSIVPPRRFVEILTQYKDGDRYCLVVRDSDNKHVIFKEMK